jgi:hypothetical protein
VAHEGVQVLVFGGALRRRVMCVCKLVFEVRVIRCVDDCCT